MSVTVNADAGADEPLLEARAVSKAFPGVQALDRVSIQVRRGRLQALLGENGAGKSTLMKILSGVCAPDSGRLLLQGQPVQLSNPRAAQQAGVAIIHQELNVLPNLTVAENIFLGREPRTAWGLIDYGAMNRRSAELLHELGLDVNPRTKTGQLKVSAQQVVEIARALSVDARVLIMDEPTSALTEHEVDALFRIIQNLKSRGVGIVYITHKLDELAAIADDVTILRDGRFVASRPFVDVTGDEIVRLMVGRDLSELYPKGQPAFGESVLRIERFSLRRPEGEGYVVRDVSLTVNRGEVVVLFGLMGAGRTELLQAIYGLHPRHSSGGVYIDGNAVCIDSPQQAIDCGMLMAPEDRKSEGLVLSMNVRENLTLASLDRVTKFGVIRRRREEGVANDYVRQFDVKTPSLRQEVRYLSGGNQQKVVLAKCLAARPKVLLLDEPTRGVDVGAKREIYAIIDELARAGLGVLMASSELPEVLGVADRVIVLSEGRVTGEFRRDDATEERLLQAVLPADRSERAISA